MDDTIQFVGRIDIAPPLNRVEHDFLTAFARTRHWSRPGGPYVVCDPASPDDRPVRPHDLSYEVPPPGQPSLWCEWSPAEDGESIAYTGTDLSTVPAEWLRYLLKHFLSPQATQRDRRHVALTGLTFDHTMYGAIVGWCPASGRMRAIEARLDRVSSRVLRHEEPPVPRERPAEVDVWSSSVHPPLTPQTSAAPREGSAVVVDLASWRR